MKRSIRLTSGLLVAILATASLSAYAFAGQNLSKHAKLSLEEARKIALQAFPGTIVKEELEQEHGGSGYRYSFDIQQGKVTHELGVDANTGTVLENSLEGPDSD